MLVKEGNPKGIINKGKNTTKNIAANKENPGIKGLKVTTGRHADHEATGWIKHLMTGITIKRKKV